MTTCASRVARFPVARKSACATVGPAGATGPTVTRALACVWTLRESQSVAVVAEPLPARLRVSATVLGKNFVSVPGVGWPAVDG